MVLYYTNTEQISASEHRIVAMSWQVNLGEERGVHQLQVDTRLTFGRSTECDVVVKSSSVEGRHASITWDHTSRSYTIHDLNTINGTFVNKEKPLFGSSRHLQSGDTFRLGCDKTHLFCFERVQDSDLPSSSTIADSATQTSPKEQLRFISSPSLPSPSHVPVIHYIPIAEAPPTVLIPSSLHASTPYFLTQVVPYSAGPLSAPSIGHPKQPSKKPDTTDSAAEEDRKPLKDDNYQLKTKSDCSRKDGRRSFEMDKIPSMSHLSSLYGRPAWWGENPTDIETSGKDSEYRVSSQHTAQSHTETLPSTIVRSESPIIDKRDDTAFVVEIAAAKRQKPTGLKNTRTTTKEHLTTSDSSKNITHSNKELSSSATLGKPPTGTKGPRKKTKVWSAPTSPSAPSTESAATVPSLPDDIRNLTYRVEASGNNEKGGDAAVTSDRDYTLHSQSETTLGQTLSPITGGRPVSARRQWKNKDHSEVLSNLMLAAVDARVKRLAEYSNETVVKVNKVLQSLAIDHPEICTHSLPRTSASSSCNELPQWKFDNPDLKSIFAGVKVIEKNLKEINASVHQLCVNSTDDKIGLEPSSSNREEDSSEIVPDSMDEEEEMTAEKRLH